MDGLVIYAKARTFKANAKKFGLKVKAINIPVRRLSALIAPWQPLHLTRLLPPHLSALWEVRIVSLNCPHTLTHDSLNSAAIDLQLRLAVLGLSCLYVVFDTVFYATVTNLTIF